MAVRGTRTAPQGEAAAAPARPAFTVGARVVNAEVTPVVPSTFVQYIRVVGEVEALHDVTVSAEESGTIAAFLAGKGERLVRGQPVTRISSDLLAAQVEEALALAEVAAERYERQRRLWQQRIGTEIGLLEVKSQAISSAARLKVLETRLARTVVTSPITGIFDQQYVEVGELVSPARVWYGFWPPIRSRWWRASPSATRWRSRRAQRYSSPSTSWRDASSAAS